MKYFSFGNENFGVFDVRFRVLSISYKLDVVFSIFLALHLLHKACVPFQDQYSAVISALNSPNQFPFSFVARIIGVQYDLFRS